MAFLRLKSLVDPVNRLVFTSLCFRYIYDLCKEKVPGETNECNNVNASQKSFRFVRSEQNFSFLRDIKAR